MFKKIMLTIVLSFMLAVAPTYAFDMSQFAINKRMSDQVVENGGRIDVNHYLISQLKEQVNITNKMQGLIIGYLYLIKKHPENADAYFKLMLNGMEQLTGVSFEKWKD